MKILIDIGHPGHVHLFRPFTEEMMKRGHVIFFTCRQKEFEIELLKASAFDYKCFGRHYKSFSGKIWGLVKFNIQMIFIAVKFKPDVFLSHGSIYAAQVAWLFGKPHISLEDSGNMEQINIYRPFTSCILVPNAFHKKLGKKQIGYNGYHELAYLHPNRFKPNNEIFNLLGLNDGGKYIIIRFVSWKASHDFSNKGLDLKTKHKLVKELSKIAKILISSEGQLPEELKPYQIKLPQEKIHDALAYATMYIGEGATMASECAMLGTPAIYVNSQTAGTLEEQEKYGLLFGFRNSNGVLEKAIELLNKPNFKKEWQKRRQRMLKDKIDVTAFMVWFIENYPESARIMKEDPDYQYRFR